MCMFDVSILSSNPKRKASTTKSAVKKQFRSNFIAAMINCGTTPPDHTLTHTRNGRLTARRTAGGFRSSMLTLCGRAKPKPRKRVQAAVLGSRIMSLPGGHRHAIGVEIVKTWSSSPRKVGSIKPPSSMSPSPQCRWLSLSLSALLHQHAFRFVDGFHKKAFFCCCCGGMDMIGVQVWHQFRLSVLGNRGACSCPSYYGLYRLMNGK